MFACRKPIHFCSMFWVNAKKTPAQKPDYTYIHSISFETEFNTLRSCFQLALAQSKVPCPTTNQPEKLFEQSGETWASTRHKEAEFHNKQNNKTKYKTHTYHLNLSNTQPHKNNTQSHKSNTKQNVNKRKPTQVTESRIHLATPHTPDNNTVSEQKLFPKPPNQNPKPHHLKTPSLNTPKQHITAN